MKKTRRPSFSTLNFFSLTRSRLSFFSCALLIFLFAAPLSASATNARDLVVGLNTLTVLKDPVKNPVTIAILYNPQNPDSLDDAKNIKKAIETDKTTLPLYDIQPTIVSTENIREIQNAKIAFLARGLTLDQFQKISATTKDSKTLTMSTDLDCVKTNNCVLGIVSRPQVEIYYSEAAALATKTEFYDIFTLLALLVPSTPTPTPSV